MWPIKRQSGAAAAAAEVPAAESGSVEVDVFHPDPPSTEACIENYEKGNQIGFGGFAKVFLAKEKGTGNNVAIKECYKNHLIKKEKVHIVMRERDALLRMDNRFIIKLHQSFQDKLTVYFVLDYMPNGVLSDYLEKYRYFRNEVTRFYSAEVIMALEYLRTVKIVHRDIKMENVLLDENFHIKLTDFGTCVTLEDHQNKKARKNSPVGTDGYFAPEILNRTIVTYGTDLWGLGCMIYEFHTGCFAFDQGREHFDRIKTARFKTFPEGSDKDIKDLVSKILVVNPAKRLGMADITKLKMHHFYGTNDVRDWEQLHTLRPPPFDPKAPGANPDDGVKLSSQVFRALSATSLAAAANTVAHKDPPEFMDWDDLKSPLVSPKPRAHQKGKCCIM